MRRSAVTAFAAFLICCLTACACLAEDDPLTRYLKSVSMYTPIAQNSARELIELGKPVPDPSPDQMDPFSYISHSKIVVPKGVRVMVFSPHPDDEAIAASGLIQRVVEKEGKVRVVYATNGDGYKEALRMKIRNGRISAKDFIAYGKMRQEESAQALCELGLQPDDAVFLGFPDDGIDDLWEEYWSKLKPFISPFTLFDRPHCKGINRWIKYSGIDFDSEIMRLITEFAPDWVVLPDPRDIHPDHMATGVFVLAALQNLYQSGQSSFVPARVFTYLVHFNDYPWAGEWSRKVNVSAVGRCSNPTTALSHSDWAVLPLSAEEIEGKRRALASHASQLQMLQWFFRNFLLQGEIFCDLNMMQVITVPQEYAAIFNHPAEPEEADRSADNQ